MKIYNLEKIYHQETQQDTGDRILQVNFSTYNQISKQKQELEEDYSKHKTKYFTYS